MPRLNDVAPDGLACWDILAGAVTLQNIENRRPLCEALGTPLDATEAATRATAFIDTALARLA